MNTIKGTILIDLDDTLIYTQKMKVKMNEYFIKGGVPEEMLENTMKEYRAQNNNHVDFRQYTEYIKKHHNIEVPQSIIDEFYSLPLEEYLKGDVINAVRELQSRGYKTYLLSKGEHEFQMFKIKNSGLHELFDPNIHICVDKKECISNLQLEGQVIIVNDRLKETKAIREMFPDFRYFHVNRDDAHDLYDKSEIDMESIDTVNDLLNILQ